MDILNFHIPKPLTQNAAASDATNTVSLDDRDLSNEVCLSNPNLSVIWIDCTNNISSRDGVLVSRVKRASVTGIPMTNKYCK